VTIGERAIGDANDDGKGYKSKTRVLKGKPQLKQRGL
jgi:hypothetical protein